MGFDLKVLRTQGSKTENGHAEVRVILTVEGVTKVDSVYFAVIKMFDGKQIVEIQHKKK